MNITIATDPDALQSLIKQLMSDGEVKSFNVEGAGGIAVVTAKRQNNHEWGHVVSTSDQGAEFLMSISTSSNDKTTTDENIQKLHALGFTQIKIANILDISQAKVSRTLSKE